MTFLRATALLAALALGACSSEVADTPCTPACAAGQTCSFGVCQVYCNPACGASQQCVVINGATQCVRVDAGYLRDAAMDAPLDGDDAPGIDAPADFASEPPPPVDADDVAGGPDIVAPDVPTEPSAPDAVAEAAVDVPRDVAADAAMDATMDAVADRPDAAPDVSPMDAPRDAAPDAAPDVAAEMPAPDAYSPPACGSLNQPCCGGVGGDVACRTGLVCNAYENGRCVAVTSPEPLECSASSTCTGGRVCQGVGYCGTRACMRCAFAGMLGFDATCDPRMAGVNCATGACITGRCSWACAPGAAGDTECATRAPGTRCQEAYYGINIVSGRPTAWVTVGSCAPACARNADCPTGRACAATPSLLGDRVDYYCAPDGRMPSGATCTASEMCQSYLCLSIPGVGRRCTTPCVADGDCPSGQRCGDITLIRPSSDADQPARACLPR